MCPGSVNASGKEERPTKYLCRPGNSTSRALAMAVLRIEDGLIANIDYFLQPKLLERFAIAAPG